MIQSDRYLGQLNDRIISSQIHLISPFILPKEIRYFSSQIGNIISLGAQLNRLPLRAGITLNMLDFDDTLYSRVPQLQLPSFQDNRGSAGDRVLEEIGHHNVLEEFYHNNRAIKRLMGIVERQGKNHRALILTAGGSDWQIGKCASVGIHGGVVPIEVVSKGADKPRRLLEYIISLGYIPGKIIIYEDRPEYFLESAAIMAKILPYTEIVIDKITLSQGNSSRQIKSIEQNIYKTNVNL